MKLLRNQGFVLVLAAIAIILVGKNLLWPMIGPKFSGRSGGAKLIVMTPPSSGAKAAAPAPQASAAPRSATPTPGRSDSSISSPTAVQNAVSGNVIPELGAVAATPEADMNLQDLWNTGSAWASSPQRDPFKMRGGINDKSAREQLTLTGILRQTESDLAVLNNRVMAAGDTILGFRIETVEGDRVWVSGPNGREMLEFKYSVQGPRAQNGAAPAPVATANPQGGGQ